MDTAGGDTIFDHLWSASQAAFGGGDHETACHALQAALARAHYLHDAVQVTAVARKAVERHSLLFQQAPDTSCRLRVHRHATRQDAIRLVYDSIVQQAPSLAKLLQRNA